MSTRDQIKQLRAEHPNWSKADIARAVVPPVSPQRVGQIENNTTPYDSSDYKERMRHKYHKRVLQVHRRKSCKYCDVLPLDKG